MNRLAKEAAVGIGPVVYDIIPKEVNVARGKDHGLQMWEQQWMDTKKRTVRKAFLPSVRKRVTQKITIFPELTTMLSGHCNINRKYTDSDKQTIGCAHVKKKNKM
ncbi:MAG: hypothetical protein FWE02_07160 [Defluviitaleaceae bacterium]|nr:hypothetical protein [Defluviitaleaceae bacterium]